jgi:hypothetical protein
MTSFGNDPLFHQLVGQILAGPHSGGQQIGGSPAMGPASAPAGAPPWSQPATPAPSSADPLSALLQGSMRYQQLQGHEDPLAAAAARGHLGNSGAFGSGSPVPTQVVDDQAQGLNRVAQLSSHGPRQGQAHTTFDLGDGRLANVYIDHSGRRRVFVFRGERS